MGLVLMAFMTFSTVSAQSNSATAQKTITGTVSDESGPLPGVSIVLKGTKTGTTTDAKGEFTFPKSLSVGDVLVFSYLGFENSEIRIKADTSVIKLTLTEDLIEMMGAVATDKPYKSKRRR